jgi:hypothetical protein
MNGNRGDERKVPIEVFGLGNLAQTIVAAEVMQPAGGFKAQIDETFAPIAEDITGDAIGFGSTGTPARRNESQRHRRICGGA